MILFIPLFICCVLMSVNSWRLSTTISIYITSSSLYFLHRFLPRAPGSLRLQDYNSFRQDPSTSWVPQWRSRMYNTNKKITVKRQMFVAFKVCRFAFLIKLALLKFADLSKNENECILKLNFRRQIFTLFPRSVKSAK